MRLREGDVESEKKLKQQHLDGIFCVLATFALGKVEVSSV